MAPNLDEIADQMLRREKPVASIQQLADELDCSDTHVRKSLRLLERNGEVESMEVGASAIAWWHRERVTPPKLPAEDHPDQTALADDDAFQERHDADERPETTPGQQAGPTARADAHADQGRDETDEQSTATETAETADDRADGLDADLDALDLPGHGALLDVRRENVRGCYELLRREGTASKSDFISGVYKNDDYDRAGYETRAGWWNAIGKQGLAELAERRDDLRAPGGEGMHAWTWLGDE